MNKVTLYIESAGERREVVLGNETSVGRTSLAREVLPDAGLSRVNTTFFRDGEDVLIVDENSTNGTFVNGEKIVGRPRLLKNGDQITLGNDTRIRVEIGGGGENRFHDGPEKREAQTAKNPNEFAAPNAFSAANSPLKTEKNSTAKPPWILIAAGLSTFAIIFLALIGYLIASRYETDAPNKNGRAATPTIQKSAVIPVRVVDPLGGEDEDDLDDLIASWEVQEEEINAANVADVTVEASAAEEEKELSVTAAFLAEQQQKAFAARGGETGIRPGGLNVPKELFGDGVVKQKAKLREMNTTGYKQPLDFAELAAKRLSKELIEMPMATASFYLDVGGSAKDSPFTAFSFQTGNAEIAQGSPKWNTLAQLAANFAGTKYDLNNPAHRKQMRMRLLRMFNQRSKPILKELADAYHAKFNRPLRVTSLTRSMDYQIGLNATNANSFKVRGEGSLPPHTSGCAFDLARKHMTAEEQNFVMAKLAEMEQRGVLDALIEYGTNACFHIFIYADGKAPQM